MKTSSHSHPRFHAYTTALFLAGLLACDAPGANAAGAKSSFQNSEWVQHYPLCQTDFLTGPALSEALEDMLHNAVDGEANAHLLAKAIKDYAQDHPTLRLPRSFGSQSFGNVDTTTQTVSLPVEGIHVANESLNLVMTFHATNNGKIEHTVVQGETSFACDSKGSLSAPQNLVFYTPQKVTPSLKRSFAEQWGHWVDPSTPSILFMDLKDSRNRTNLQLMVETFFPPKKGKAPFPDGVAFHPFGNERSTAFYLAEGQLVEGVFGRLASSSNPLPSVQFDIPHLFFGDRNATTPPTTCQSCVFAIRGVETFKSIDMVAILHPLAVSESYDFLVKTLEKSISTSIQAQRLHPKLVVKLHIVMDVHAHYDWNVTNEQDIRDWADRKFQIDFDHPHVQISPVIAIYEPSSTNED